MKIKKANLKRLASLSALGAGALGGTVRTAEASSIVFSGPVGAQVGYCPGCLDGFLFPGPHGASGAIGMGAYFTSSGRGFRSVWVGGHGAGKHGTVLDFAVATSHFGDTHLIAALPQGSLWGPTGWRRPLLSLPCPLSPEATGTIPWLPLSMQQIGTSCSSSQAAICIRMSMVGRNCRSGSIPTRYAQIGLRDAST
jgi:hypothetical protein